MFHFINLLGTQSDSKAYQSLLEFDNGIRILVDVGWDESFSLDLLKELEKYTPTISLILFTHPTVAHIGAYAHACKHIPHFRQIPVYATFPVLSLGRLLLQDLYLSHPAAHGHLVDSFNTSLSITSTFNQPAIPAPKPVAPPGSELWLLSPPTSAEIEGYFSSITQLKYSQPHPISFLSSPVTITAYSAGHSLGGTIWKITHGQESVVHAVNWNHSRENVLSGAAFLPPGSAGVNPETLGRPTALICSARQPDLLTPGAPLTRKQRDETLLGTIKNVAVQGRGTVLIPTDSAARVLELVYLLEQAWRKDPQLGGRDGNRPIALYLIGRRGKRLGKVVGRMLEWMDESVLKVLENSAPTQENNNQSNANSSENRNRRRGRFNNQGQTGASTNPAAADKQESAMGPFDFVHVKVLEKRSEMEKVLSEEGDGRVILVADASLEWGFSKDILLRTAEDEKNCIVLTEMVATGIAKELFAEWKERANAAGNFAEVEERERELTFHKRVPLEGDELGAYNSYLSESLALRTQHPGALSSAGPTGLLPTAADDDDDISSESDTDDESDSEKQGKSLSALMVKKLPGLSLQGQKVDIGVNILLRGKGVYDFDVRLAKGRNRMFPFAPKRRRADEYGEFVRLEDYMRVEERGEMNLDEEDTKVKRPNTPPERVMGRKRKWEEAGVDRAPDASLKKRKGGKDKVNDDKESGEEDEEEEGEIAESEEEAEEEDEEVEIEELFALPSKITEEKHSVTIRAKVTFIDFQGLHDSRSLRMLLPLIKPRKLILVSGNSEQTSSLATHCRNLWNPKTADAQREVEVLTPKSLEIVDASVDTNAWVLKLSDALARSFSWQTVGNLSVAHVMGKIALPQKAEPDGEGDDPEHKDKKQKFTSPPPSTALARTSQTSTLPAILEPPPHSLLSSSRITYNPIHVGDIKLADLRKALREKGITAEFRGEGSLLCDGAVMVRKVGVGRVVLEDGGGGWRGNVWKRVRDVVYGGLAVVVGS